MAGYHLTFDKGDLNGYSKDKKKMTGKIYYNTILYRYLILNSPNNVNIIF